MSDRKYLFDMDLSYSRKLTFTRHEYKGLPYVNIEVHRRRYGEFKPAGNTVTIPVHKLEAFARIFNGMAKSMAAEIEKHRPGGE